MDVKQLGRTEKCQEESHCRMEKSDKTRLFSLENRELGGDLTAVY